MLIKMQGAAFQKLDPANFDTAGDCNMTKMYGWISSSLAMGYELQDNLKSNCPTFQFVDACRFKLQEGIQR
jgi:hypothetical protein